MENHGREVNHYDGGVAQLKGRLEKLDPRLLGAVQDKSQDTPKDMHVFSSGAKSTVVKPRYDLIPLAALILVAERFAYGAGRHGARNYRRGAGDEVFVTDRINHLQEHLSKFAEHRRREDLAAILCNAAILADVGAFVGGEDFIKEALESVHKADARLKHAQMEQERARSEMAGSAQTVAGWSNLQQCESADPRDRR